MPKLDERPSSSPRGRRRREQLVDAGVELLAEGGWPAVTTRSVAERAGANLGLIHYHLGGLPQLKAAIARQAGELIFGPLTGQLLEADGVGDLLSRLPAMVTPPTDDATARLTVELIAGAVREPELGDVLRESLAEARAALTGWLRIHRPDAPEGTATLLVALLDGLFLHHMLDPRMRAGEAVGALTALAAHVPEPPAPAPGVDGSP